MVFDLLSTTSRVEVPFITVDIAGYTFGVWNRKNGKFNGTSRWNYPNFMKSMTISKVNGQVNTYKIQMVYPIQAGDDPNMLDKVFSASASNNPLGSRKIKISYGDLAVPSFTYKEEIAFMDKVTSSIDINSSTITYNISCISQALTLTAGDHDFPQRKAKPSSVIIELLQDKSFGMQEVFSGMTDMLKVMKNNLIATDDREVVIPQKTNIKVFEYLNFLVNCMESKEDLGEDAFSKHKYTIVTYDDITGIMGGPYFKVSKLSKNVQQTNSLDVYEVDVGYPNNVVTSFTVQDDETYSIYYDFQEKINFPDNVYRINDQGKIDTVYSPTLARSPRLYKTTPAEKTWWSYVTNYPIKASMEIRGLLRPAMLMQYLKVNVLFYGREHISSGYYVVSAQNDTISESGFKTNLSLIRLPLGENK